MIIVSIIELIIICILLKVIFDKVKVISKLENLIRNDYVKNNIELYKSKNNKLKERIDMYHKEVGKLNKKILELKHKYE